MSKRNFRLEVTCVIVAIRSAIRRNDGRVGKYAMLSALIDEHAYDAVQKAYNTLLRQRAIVVSKDSDGVIRVSEDTQ